MVPERAPFPATRLRRLRQHAWLRDLVQEHRLHPSELIWPVFLCEGQKQRIDIPSMPGVQRYSVDVAVVEIARAHQLGIQAIALFPQVPDNLKTPDGAEAFRKDNLVCTATRAIKQNVPGVGIICDVALDPYTDHGQDGLVVDGEVHNDRSVEALQRQSLNQARAGADILAPSDMMDGRIAAIRDALDTESFEKVVLLSYAAKYASSFYGPFRDAIGSTSNLKGDKRSYQMNPGNSNVALHEVALDLQEGADMVMVKPAMPYMDIIGDIKRTFKVPTLAYQVSGEYAMLKFAAIAGALTWDEVMLESLLGLKRAGSDAIFTYAARDIASLLSKA